MNNKIFKTRFYNSVALNNNKIVKISDSVRIKKEQDWFLSAKQTIPDNIPLIYEVQTFNNISKIVMEYINGENLYDTLRHVTSKVFVAKYIESVSKVSKELHAEMYPANKTDFKKMYLEKPLKSLEFFYSKYGEQYKEKDKIVINNRNCTKPEVLLLEKYKELQHKVSSNKYTLIHGDLTLSNIIVGKDFNIFLIDPRGGFGDTKNYGDPNYDIAKFYFSLIGNFDSLNNHHFSLSVKDNIYSYNIPPIINNFKVSWLENQFWKYFPADKEIIKFIHCTIWLSLLPHLEESENQTITAFLQGTYLLNTI